MSVFFVHDPAQGIVTPLDKSYFRRDIQPTSEVSETGAIHPKTGPDTPYPERQVKAAVQEYEKVDEQDKQDMGTVGEYMSSPLISIDQKASLSSAWQLMRKHEIHHLAIVNEHGFVSGMLTENLILNHMMLKDAPAPGNTTLDSFCSKKVLSTSPHTEIDALAEGLLERELSGIPVTDNGVVVGMITRSDLLKVFIEKKHLFLEA